MRGPGSRQWTLTGRECDNSIRDRARRREGSEEKEKEEKEKEEEEEEQEGIGREKERRRGGSRFTHTKSRRARIVHDGNQTHKSEA